MKKKPTDKIIFFEDQEIKHSRRYSLQIAMKYSDLVPTLKPKGKGINPSPLMLLKDESDKSFSDNELNKKNKFIQKCLKKIFIAPGSSSTMQLPKCIISKINDNQDNKLIENKNENNLLNKVNSFSSRKHSILDLLQKKKSIE